MKHRLIKCTLLFGMMLFCATGTGFAGEAGNDSSCPLGMSGETISIVQKYFCRDAKDFVYKAGMREVNSICQKAFGIFEPTELEKLLRESEKPDASDAQVPEEEKPSEPAVDETETDRVGDIAGTVANLVNAERKEAGLSALKLDSSISAAAQKKAEDMRDHHYFSHTSPTYGSPFEMMRAMGISFSAAGENIAKGQKTPEQVMNAWMNSQGHRANILSTSYEKIGVGYVVDESGTTYWVQLFAK